MEVVLDLAFQVILEFLVEFPINLRPAEQGPNS